MRSFFTKIQIFIVVALLTCREVDAYASTSMVDSILRVLDREISIAETEYRLPKEHRIDNLRRAVKAAPDRQSLFDTYKSLYEEYLTYQYDSAYCYARRMEDLAAQAGSELMRVQAQAALLSCFSRVGFFNEGMETYKSMDPILLSPGERIGYYFSAASLLHNMESFAGSDADLSKNYKSRRVACYDSIISLAGVNTYNYDLAKLEKQRVGNFSDDKALAMSRALVARYNLSDYQKAKSYSTMGQSYAFHNKTDSAIYCFAMSVICDLRSSVKENTSARNLATLMLQIGDIERASRYINLASADAKTYNSRLRMSEINTIMPAINAAHHNKISSQRSLLFISLLFFGLMLIVVLLLLVKLRKKNASLIESNKEINRKNSELEIANGNLVDLNTRLKETDEIKSQYIIESLRKKTEFANEVEGKSRKALSKLNAKKYGEVATMLEDMGTQEELARSFTSFDSAFLRLFPNFIDELNKMFHPDAQITLDDGRLPTEIRIFALMRLGFTSSAEIAKYLGLSVNTIYVYKAKIKARVIVDKSEFETRIMSIPKA